MNAAPQTIARSDLILGGQKSGKSRRAELLARQWLQAAPAHRALLLATGQPWDDEMRARIARHQRERGERVPGLQTVEEPRDLAGVAWSIWCTASPIWPTPWRATAPHRP